MLGENVILLEMSALKQPRNSFNLQERDLALLRDLFESRIMTAAHTAALFFDGKREATKKRLQKLKAAGLIGERARRVYEPAILFLTDQGIKLLKERGMLTDYPALSMPALEKRARVGAATVRHELEVMDVKAAVHEAIRLTMTFSVAEFGTWPRLYQFEAATPQGGESMVRPDGFIRIHETEPDGGLSEHAFFLELDRSTETLDTLVSRANGYLDFYKSGGFAVRNGGARSAYKEFPFRVLMVFKSAERRNNMTECLLRNIPPILTQICLSTIEEVRKDPLGSIWIRPVDYRTATAGTPFDSDREGMRQGYQRQVAREAFVEKQIEKHRLLEN